MTLLVSCDKLMLSCGIFAAANPFLFLQVQQHNEMKIQYLQLLSFEVAREPSEHFQSHYSAGKMGLEPLGMTDSWNQSPFLLGIEMYACGE